MNAQDFPPSKTGTLGDGMRRHSRRGSSALALRSEHSPRCCVGTALAPVLARCVRPVLFSILSAYLQLRFSLRGCSASCVGAQGPVSPVTLHLPLQRVQYRCSRNPCHPWQ